jgi:hypothetical protein
MEGGLKDNAGEIITSIQDLDGTYQVESGENAFNGSYPDEYGREFNFVINGKGKEDKKNKLRIEGLRCLEGPCPVPVLIDGILLEEEYRLWSESASWEGGGKPQPGDDVVIKATWNMLLDEQNVGPFNSVTINGRLTFKEDIGDITFKSHNIWVQQGQFYIGTSTQPFTNNAEIELLGMQDDPTLVVSGSIEAGNKILLNTGKVKWFGAGRNKNMSRLRGEVNSNMNTATVEAGLDWTTGDKLYFAPTSMQEDQSDYLTIVSYNDVSGALTLNGNFNHYHWGEASEPTLELDGK